MIIHVVKPGDSLYTLAKQYGISLNDILQVNKLSDPNILTVGQSVIIPQQRALYTVRSGDTVSAIAQRYGVTTASILAINPDLGDGSQIYPDQIIIIPTNNTVKREIEVNGYTFPDVDQNLLNQALPYLTYLSIFAYRARTDGSLDTINDQPLLQFSRENRIAPIMVITNISESGGFSTEIGQTLLNDQTVQSTLIQNIQTIMREKNYYALNIDFEYIRPQDREAYNTFLRRITNTMHENGYPVFTALAPKLNADQKGLLYEAHDYPAHGQIADRVILMTYEWGYLAGPPQAIAPIDQVQRVIEYAISVIPPQKILLGIPNYAYDWTLPYQRGTLAQIFSPAEAVRRAHLHHAAIEYDTVAQSPYYRYYDANHQEHIVWFEDARSIQKKLQLVEKYGLAGISYWTVDREFSQNWSVLNATFDIKSIL